MDVAIASSPQVESVCFAEHFLCSYIRSLRARPVRPKKRDYLTEEKTEHKVISEGAHQLCKTLERPVSEYLNAKITEVRNRNGMAVVAFRLVWVPIIFSKVQGRI